MSFRRQLLENLGPGPAFEPAAVPFAGPAAPPVRLIAYYLPQFHPIPENDRWWGPGFTEWTNVSRAVPRFVGQYQPHLPADLGFYDLRLPETLARQSSLARDAGLHGFCFHYYWFNGRRLLETPLNILLAHPEIDIGFCINWANESWTRAWDGDDKEILIAQSHSEADDIAFAEALAPLLRDPRYIRVNGRPVVMLYRPGLLPDAAGTLRHWRHRLAELGLGDPLLIMPQCFGEHDPRRYGFDAAAGFPPHKVGWSCGDLAYMCRPFEPGFNGRVLSYDEMALKAMREDDPPFRLFHGVCPGWDNEARKPGRGTSFVNATPPKYAEWLRWACAQALRVPQPEERIVFINAWNEWAEGAHLEPDRHHGYAYLNATARTLTAIANAEAATEGSGIHHGPPTLPVPWMNAQARLKAPLRQLWHRRRKTAA